MADPVEVEPVSEPDPPQGSVSFWERIGKLGLAMLLAIGIVVAGLVAFFLDKEFTEPIKWAWYAALIFAFGSTAVAAVAGYMKR